MVAQREDGTSTDHVAVLLAKRMDPLMWTAITRPNASNDKRASPPESQERNLRIGREQGPRNDQMDGGGGGGKGNQGGYRGQGNGGNRRLGIKAKANGTTPKVGIKGKEAGKEAGTQRIEKTPRIPRKQRTQRMRRTRRMQKMRRPRKRQLRPFVVEGQQEIQRSTGPLVV